MSPEPGRVLSLTERALAAAARAAARPPRRPAVVDTGPVQEDSGEALALLVEHLGAEVVEEWRLGQDGTWSNGGGLVSYSRP